jgi:hypothetical protein
LTIFSSFVVTLGVMGVREITHLEAEGGKLPLAIAIRDSSFEVTVTVEQDEGEETLTLEFPK